MRQKHRLSSKSNCFFWWQ